MAETTSTPAVTNNRTVVATDTSYIVPKLEPLLSASMDTTIEESIIGRMGRVRIKIVGSVTEIDAEKNGDDELGLEFSNDLSRCAVHGSQAAPAAPVIKQLSSILKWTARSSSKSPLSDGNILQFEDGYLVETVVEGNQLGIVPYSIRVSRDVELYAVNAVNSNIVRITPPLSQLSN
ncbi:hypothetical protein L1887_19087 [Cichorium endivia]|nr:hypothetical protein L1887_19087 [Cichorium endivia]